MTAPLKRKRIVLNMKQKIDIIDRLSKGESAVVLAKEYNIGRSSVTSIKSSKDSILNYVSTLESKQGMHKRKTMKNAVNKELEQAIFDWYVKKKSSGQSVSGPMICGKALELNNNIGGSPNFKASSGWLKNFKSRHGLRLAENDCDEYTHDYDENVQNVYTPLKLPSNQSINDQININNSQNMEGILPECQVSISVSSSEIELEDSEMRNGEVLNTEDDARPSHSEAFYALDAAFDWYEKQSECDPSVIINIMQLRDLAYKKAMSAAFSSNGTESVNQRISVSSEKRDETYSIDDAYEISRCVKWIQENNFSKVALQFPDNFLNDSASVALKLEEQTGKQTFVLGDTSYGSCCVDEITSEHVMAEGIIHYGHACLSSTKRLPVLYIFGKNYMNVEDCAKEFTKMFPQKDMNIVVLYEVLYSHAIEHLAEKLKGYRNLIISQLDIPNSECNSEFQGADSQKIVKCGRRFYLSRTLNVENYNMFYIGSQNQTLTNFMLSFNSNKFYSYYPTQKTGQPETLDINKYLRKRYYYVEKAKDANIIGILVGTLGVADYLTMVKHLRELIRESGKKSYTIAVGKLNNAKLANFAEIEVFVFVGCMESSLIDSHDFYQPIVTPFELEVACNQARKWTGDYITDFGELLPGAVNYLPPNEIQKVEGDVSLVTGKMRSTGLLTTNTDNVADLALVSRPDMEVAFIHSEAAGEFLSNRSWQGLEQKLGETPVDDIIQGKIGIAAGYEDEKTLCEENSFT